MSPRTIAAIAGVTAIAVGTFLVILGFGAGPDFVTSTGSACDPAVEWQDYSLGDCLPVERHSPTFGTVLVAVGLLALIYARLVMAPARKA